MENLSYGGIDVSKDRLDVVVLPEGWFFSVSNDTAGWAELVARLRPLAVCAIGLEPSGGYERGIIRALLAAGLSVRRINPNKLRQFARARGVLAKNDRLDARLIAEYVAIMPTRVVQRDDAVERLAEIVTMRRQLCDEHVAVENQAGHLEDVMLRRLSKRRLIRLEADIRLLDKRLAEMVATNAAFAQLYELLTSMPGVGPVLAFTLIALLPELGKMSRKQIAALLGGVVVEDDVDDLPAGLLGLDRVQEAHELLMAVALMLRPMMVSSRTLSAVNRVAAPWRL